MNNIIEHESREDDNVLSERNIKKRKIVFIYEYFIVIIFYYAICRTELNAILD